MLVNHTGAFSRYSRQRGRRLSPLRWQQPMAFMISIKRVNEQLGMIERVLSGIEKGGGAIHIRDLASLLVDLISVLERDPGLEAAADDLHAAAERVMRDSHVGAQPHAKKQRLLREAHLRFCSRLAAAMRRLEQQEQIACFTPAALRAA